MDDTDPLVTVMKVEKAPQETYADIGGLDNQIQEIKVFILLTLCANCSRCYDMYCFKDFLKDVVGILCSNLFETRCLWLSLKTPVVFC